MVMSGFGACWESARACVQLGLAWESLNIGAGGAGWTEVGSGGCPESKSVGRIPACSPGSGRWCRRIPRKLLGQVPAPVSASRAASVRRFCTLGAPAVAMETPALCLNAKSCLWPWSRGWGQTPGRGQQAAAALPAIPLLWSASAGSGYPHPGAGQGVTPSAVSRHRPAAAGHPVGGGAGREDPGPGHAGVPGAGGAGLPALRLSAPRPGLSRLAALHPLRSLSRGVLHHRDAAGAPPPRQGERGRAGTAGTRPGPGVTARSSRRGTSTSSR